LKQHLKIGFFKAVFEQENNCLHFNVVLKSVKLKWKEALEFQSFFFQSLVSNMYSKHNFKTKKINFSKLLLKFPNEMYSIS
jgi:hypothetical protein